MVRRLFWGVLVIGLLSACFERNGGSGAGGAGSGDAGSGDAGSKTQGGSGPGQGRSGSSAPKPGGAGSGAGAGSGSGSGSGSGAGSVAGSGGGGGKRPDDPPPCVVGSGNTIEIATTNVDKVDLLFAIDNTETMGEEQAALAATFPRLIQRLVTGDGFAPAKDIHLGVVSTNMGAIGANGLTGCEGLGDDGLMLNTPSPTIGSCLPSYPRFLSYVAGFGLPEQTARDFGCVASLGTVGCPMRQPLESALKALWPRHDPMAVNGMNRITFLPDADGFGLDGQGDGPNLGFLRNDPLMGLSVIAIVVVTDGDDCSSLDPGSLAPLTANDSTSLDLRCFSNPKSLYVLERYIQGYKELRPGNPALVVFSVIAGVPADLVEPDDYAKLDWTSDANREAFYSQVLSDPRMVQTVDPLSQGAQLVPSCNTDRGRAHPPRRLVQLARGFGANSSIHSVCVGDLSSAIDGVTERIGSRLGASCLPRQPVRGMDGMVPCQVEWVLPLIPVSPQTPASCDTLGFSFLSSPSGDRPRVDATGATICEVAQLRVVDGAYVPTTTADGRMINDGWYYDDFSSEVPKGCTGRIAFSPAAKPPTGVKARLTCEGFDVMPTPACP